MAHAREIIGVGFLKILVHGNQPVEFAENVAKLATTTLGISPLPKKDYPDIVVNMCVMHTSSLSEQCLHSPQQGVNFFFYILQLFFTLFSSLYSLSSLALFTRSLHSLSSVTLLPSSLPQLL